MASSVFLILLIVTNNAMNWKIVVHIMVVFMCDLARRICSDTRDLKGRTDVT